MHFSLSEHYWESVDFGGIFLDFLRFSMDFHVHEKAGDSAVYTAPALSPAGTV